MQTPDLIPPPPKAPKSTGKRLLLLLAFMISTILIVKFTPLGAWLSVENMKNLVESTGIWGYFIFVAMFVIAAVMNVPGTAFLLLGVLLFDYWTGATLSYFGALIGAIVTFYIGRSVGGQALSEIKNPKIKNVLKKAEFYPIRTMIILRILVQLSPFIGYTLALTKINTRSYIIANVIALFIPVVGLTVGMYLFQDVIMSVFGGQ